MVLIIAGSVYQAPQRRLAMSLYQQNANFVQLRTNNGNSWISLVNLKYLLGNILFHL